MDGREVHGWPRPELQHPVLPSKQETPLWGTVGQVWHAGVQGDSALGTMSPQGDTQPRGQCLCQKHHGKHHPWCRLPEAGGQVCRGVEAAACQQGGRRGDVWCLCGEFRGEGYWVGAGAVNLLRDCTLLG